MFSPRLCKSWIAHILCWHRHTRPCLTSTWDFFSCKDGKGMWKMKVCARQMGVLLRKQIQILHVSSLASWCPLCWGWAGGEQPCAPSRGKPPVLRGNAPQSSDPQTIPGFPGQFCLSEQSAQPPADLLHQFQFAPPLARAGFWNHWRKPAPG